MSRGGSVTEVVPITPAEVFDLVTDVGRLPEWNRVITDVVEHPGRIETGSEWVVTLHALGSSWSSRARASTVDAAAGHFSYRSQSDDDNPSYADWSWQIVDDPGGARVTVTWDLHPKTFWRRVLLAPIRGRQIRREVRASLRSLASVGRRT
jgi:Polyketide cyclase / dehydrase and lipid transport